jgi:ribosomal 50S subunit-recycling heat shock protein
MVAIAGVVATISRALAQRLIDDGQVRLAGHRSGKPTTACVSVM